MSKDRDELAALMDAVNKRYNEEGGRPVLIRASQSSFLEVPRIETDVLAVDYVTGGGIPMGRVTMLLGEPSSGKSFVAALIVRGAQHKCKHCAKRLKRAATEGWRAYEATWAKWTEGRELEPHETIYTPPQEFKDANERPQHYDYTHEVEGECKEPAPFTTLWHDAEGTYEVAWAEDVGADSDHILLIRTEYAEQGIDICDEVLRTNKCQLQVIDSVAHLTPGKEITTSSESAEPGLQARLVNKASRKWVSAMNTSLHESIKPTIVLIQHIYHKVGVVFGCFEYNAKVTLADGTRKRIGEIVRDRLPLEVLSVVDGAVVPRRIVDWHDNGPTKEWLQVRVSRPGTMSQFKCTAGHRIAMADGTFRAAGDLHPGDLVLSNYRRQWSDRGLVLALGMAIGDGNIRAASAAGAYLRFEHGPKQHEYAQWKAALLGPLVSNAGAHDRGHVGVTWKVETGHAVELRGLYDTLYGEDGKKRASSEMLERLTPLEVAIWCMDDGCLSIHHKWGRDRFQLAIHGFTEADRERIATFFRDRGMGCALYGGTLAFTADGTFWLQEAIHTHVPPCMDYKLSPEFRGKFVQPEVVAAEQGWGVAPFAVLSVGAAPMCSKGGHRKPTSRYDITVGEGACYFVSDVLVHNSPETIRGGRNQRYITSVEVKFLNAKYEYEKVGTEEIPQFATFRINCAKNKVALAHRDAEFNVWLRDTQGHRRAEVDDIEDVLKRAVALGLVHEEGKNWQFGDFVEPSKKVLRERLTDPANRHVVRNLVLKTMLRLR